MKLYFEIVYFSKFSIGILVVVGIVLLDKESQQNVCQT